MNAIIKLLWKTRWYRTILRRELTEYLVAQVGNKHKQISKNIDKYFENKKNNNNK
ncbi:MAG TPA: hypothetical protein PKL96_10870 [Bacteroidales bacterium]|jgi:hypothetical protein|nr:hypothetical protein [Bacteroidales bacterium]